jgi:type IV secretory pathway TrbL component
MGWEVALAGSAIQGVGQVMAGKAQAKAGQESAGLALKQAEENRALKT